MPDWFAALGRLGHSAKGTVYLLVGALACAAAFGRGGSVGGSQNALVAVVQAPLGQLTLAVISVGLFCYATWRLAQAAYDTADQGGDLQGIGVRLSYVLSGLVYLGLGLFAAALVFGASSRSTATPEDWTATLMHQPYGRWLVGIAGVVALGFGLRQFERAYRAGFMRFFDSSHMSSRELTTCRRLGRAGLTARGVVFSIVGLFIVQAAWNADPSHSRGLGGALSALANRPLGSWLLGIVAVGLGAYGVLCFGYARYRAFHRS